MPSVLLIIQAVYGLFSVLLYILMIFFLFRNKKEFSNVYYTIVRYSGITEIVVYILDLFIQRLQIYPEFENFYLNLYRNCPFLAHDVWIVYASFHMVNLPILLSGVQRLTLLSNPIKGDLILRKIVLNFFICLPFVSFALTSFIPFTAPKVVFKDGRFQWDLQQSSMVFLIMSVFSGGYFIVNCIINVISIIYLNRYKNTVRYVKRMFLISFFIGMLQTVYMVFLVLFTLSIIFNLGLNSFLEDLVLPFVLDATCLITPWLHLLFNKPIRTAFLRQMRIITKPSVVIQSVMKS